MATKDNFNKRDLLCRAAYALHELQKKCKGVKGELPEISAENNAQAFSKFLAHIAYLSANGENPSGEPPSAVNLEAIADPVQAAHVKQAMTRLWNIFQAPTDELAKASFLPNTKIKRSLKILAKEFLQNATNPGEISAPIPVPGDVSE